MREWLRAKWDRLRSSYWFIPALMSLAAVLLSFVSIRIDQEYRYEVLRDQGWIYTGGPEGARAVLSAIAGSIITVAGTTFSITIAALSLASAQFGPRLLRNFMRDTGNQVVLGTFTSTFLYCLLVLRTVRGLDDNEYVPHISVTGGVLLAVFSLAILIYFIHHVAESIQVSNLIDVVGRELNGAVSRIFPERAGEVADQELPVLRPKAEVVAHHEGYVQAVDERTLLGIAGEKDLLIEVLRRPGEYVIAGVPIAVVYSDITESEASHIRRAFTLGRDRTPHQDAVFAFLQLAEIGLRALSPGVNDPFTAIMCIDRITSAMNQLADRSLPAPHRRDHSHKVRLIAHPYTYEELVEAGYRHIRESAMNQWQVCRHMKERLEFLVARVRDDRFRAALQKELLTLR